ncbi:MAG TPA: ArsR family transcriptional regulator [Gemmatimonadaceae bacterium]|nr:ArsR family transcriptional regulator [Gemmatimonadaceae bacterium]
MLNAPSNERFQQSSRGRLLALLRIGPRSVDELASELGLTDNAIRQHLAGLERDGLVRAAGTRRTGTAGKPATLYELHAEAEPLLSRAYAPVLATLLEVIGDEVPTPQARRILRETGRRLAVAAGGRATGDFSARVEAAARVLTALGGSVRIEQSRGRATIHGAACPLAMAVARNARVCHAVETLVGEIAGASAEERCDRSDRPHCCFALRSA